MTSNSSSINNALPWVVLGDFGEAGVEGDDFSKLPMAVTAQDEEDFVDWEDIYTMGKILRELAMTQIPSDDIGDSFNDD